MKNIFIITILSLFFCNVGFAETITGGPNTTDEAIEQFFKGRKLDKIEGIWHQDVEGAKYAIVKGNDEIYEIWTLEHKTSIFSGTKDTNKYLKKTSEDKENLLNERASNIAVDAAKKALDEVLKQNAELQKKDWDGYKKDLDLTLTPVKKSLEAQFRRIGAPEITIPAFVVPKKLAKIPHIFQNILNLKIYIHLFFLIATQMINLFLLQISQIYLNFL